MTTGLHITVAQLAFVLRLLMMVGYPMVAMFASVVPLPPSWLSIAFRLFIFIAAIVVLVMSLKSFRQNTGFLLLCLFFLILFIRVLVDFTVPGSAIGTRHVMLLVVIVTVPVFAIAVHGLRGETDKQLAKSLTLLGLGMMLFMIAIWATGRAYNAWADVGGVTDRLALAGLNPISVGSVAVVTLLASLTIVTRLRLSRDWRILGVVTAVAAVLVIFLANSRGPIVAGGAAAMWLVLSNLKRGIWILGLMAGAIAVVLLTTDLLSAVLGRFDFDTVGNLSNNLRLTSQLAAIQAFLNNPVLGAFLVNPDMPPELYPHNLIIETAMALGMLGLLVLGLILFTGFFRVMQFYGAEHPLLTALLIHYFLLAQFSGTIVGQDAMFMLLALAVTTRRQVRKSAPAPLAGISRRGAGFLGSVPPDTVAGRV